MTTNWPLSVRLGMLLFAFFLIRLTAYGEAPALDAKAIADIARTRPGRAR